jgi:hypothetical protein
VFSGRDLRLRSGNRERPPFRLLILATALFSLGCGLTTRKFARLPHPILTLRQRRWLSPLAQRLVRRQSVMRTQLCGHPPSRSCAVIEVGFICRIGNRSDDAALAHFINRTETTEFQHRSVGSGRNRVSPRSPLFIYYGLLRVQAERQRVSMSHLAAPRASRQPLRKERRSVDDVQKSGAEELYQSAVKRRSQLTDGSPYRVAGRLVYKFATVLTSAQAEEPHQHPVLKRFSK